MNEKKKFELKSFNPIYPVIIGYFLFFFFIINRTDISPKTLIITTIVIILYFIPSIIASQRKHQNGVIIFLLNLFLGWTIIGWIGALVWSATGTHIKKSKEKTDSEKENSLDIIKRKFAEGKISEKEYKKRKKILGE